MVLKLPALPTLLQFHIMAVVHLKGAEFKSVVQFISYQFIRVYTDLTQLIDFINLPILGKAMKSST